MKIPEFPKGRCPFCGVDQGFLIIASCLSDYLFQLKERSEKYKTYAEMGKEISDVLTGLQKEIDAKVRRPNEK